MERARGKVESDGCFGLWDCHPTPPSLEKFPPSAWENRAAFLRSSSKVMFCVPKYFWRSLRKSCSSPGPACLCKYHSFSHLYASRLPCLQLNFSLSIPDSSSVSPWHGFLCLHALASTFKDRNQGKVLIFIKVFHSCSRVKWCKIRKEPSLSS